MTSPYAPSVGLVSPGDMGAGVATFLVGRGVLVRAALADRSERTRALARDAGIEDVGDLGSLVSDSEVILSIVPPAAARSVAVDVAAAIGSTAARPLYVDCNAISPDTAREVAAVVLGSGASFVDASIVGPPPRAITNTRFYACGPDEAAFVRFGEYAGLDIRPLGSEVGRASGLKMLYASITKGIPAISLGLLVAAWRLGIYEDTVAELELSQTEIHQRMQRTLGRVPSVAARWVGEMEEIAKTMETVGLTPLIFEGAAEMYRFVSSASFDETPETIDRDRTLEQLVAGLASASAR